LESEDHVVLVHPHKKKASGYLRVQIEKSMHDPTKVFYGCKASAGGREWGAVLLPKYVSFGGLEEMNVRYDKVSQLLSSREHRVWQVRSTGEVERSMSHGAYRGWRGDDDGPSGAYVSANHCQEGSGIPTHTLSPLI
jgi:hypothetical protein